MKLLNVIGLALASALLMSISTTAAVPLAFGPDAPLLAPLGLDCQASLAVDQVRLFVNATEDCDATMAELTGLCLAEVTEPLPPRVAAAFAPNEAISCTGLNPSPPG